MRLPVARPDTRHREQARERPEQHMKPERTDALIVRVGALGDTIAAEPFVRAVWQQRGFENVYVRADSYAEVFWNHPVAKPGPAPGPCEIFEIGRAHV